MDSILLPVVGILFVASAVGGSLGYGFPSIAALAVIFFWQANVSHCRRTDTYLFSTKHDSS